jgi:hypothetical protein
MFNDRRRLVMALIAPQVPCHPGEHPEDSDPPALPDGPPAAFGFDDRATPDLWLGRTFGAWADALPDDEHAALCAYKDDGQCTVNAPLRAGAPLSAQQERQVALLDRALARFALPEPVVVHRGFQLAGPPVLGARIEDPAFVSTSLMRGLAEAFVIEQPPHPALARVLVPAGTRCGAPDLAAYVGEVEILLPRGSAFVVRAAHAPGTGYCCYWRVDLELIA